MNRFTPALKELNGRLALPQPARARVLLEVAADLDDAFELGLGQGLSEGEAERLALDAFAPDSETVAQLVRVHGGLVAGLLDGASEQARSLWERAMLAAIAACALFMSGRLLVDFNIFSVAGRGSWPLVGLAAVAVVIVVAKSYQLFIRRDHRPRALRRGLGLLVAVASAQLAAGVSLVVIDVYGWLTALISIWPQSPEDPLKLLLRGSALATIAMFGAIASAVMWFFLNQRVARIEVAEAQLLLQLERSS
jgi:hypothetical protein